MTKISRTIQHLLALVLKSKSSNLTLQILNNYIHLKLLNNFQGHFIYIQLKKKMTLVCRLFLEQMSLKYEHE
jgi:hypothetical protein